MQLGAGCEQCKWLQDAEDFDWIAERVAMAAPDSFEAWEMRGDARRGLAMATGGSTRVAKLFYERAARLCPGDMTAHMREKAAACDRGPEQTVGGADEGSLQCMPCSATEERHSGEV